MSMSHARISKPIPMLKSNAKLLQKEFDISRTEALDVVAKLEGFSSWSLLASRHEQITAAQSMFPHVLFVCEGGYKQNHNYIQALHLNDEDCFKIDCDDLVKGYVAAIQTKNYDAFTEQYLFYPILIITNIHRLHNKPATQREVVRILEKRKRKTIVTSLVSKEEITKAGEEGFSRDFRSLLVECNAT